MEGPQGVLRCPQRSHKDRVSVLSAHPTKVTEVTVVVLGVMTAADVREVTGGGDMNWQLQARHAQRSCSVLHNLNRVCILFIFCISVSLFVDEVWRDTAWYWAQERGEGSTGFLVALVFGGIGNIGGEDGIFNSGLSGRRHVLSRSGELGNVWFMYTPYMHF